MEAMSVESIIQAYWQIQNYFTIPRFGFEKKGEDDEKKWGNYSDIDMLAFKPKTKSDDTVKAEISKNILVLCESKAHGGKNQIVYRDFDKSYLSFKDIEEQHKEDHTKDLIHFINGNVKYLLKNENLLSGLVNLEEIDVLKLQFVSTIIFHNQDKVKPLIVSHLKEFLKDKPSYAFEIEIELITHFDVICRLFLLVQQNESGKRYGNQILDFIREINRYLHVDKCQGIREIKLMEPSDYKKTTDENYTKYGMLTNLFQTKLIDTMSETDFTKSIHEYENISELIIGKGN